MLYAVQFGWNFRDTLSADLDNYIRKYANNAWKQKWQLVSAILYKNELLPTIEINNRINNHKNCLIFLV